MFYDLLKKELVKMTNPNPKTISVDYNQCMGDIKKCPAKLKTSYF